MIDAACERLGAPNGLNLHEPFFVNLVLSLTSRIQIEICAERTIHNRPLAEKALVQPSSASFLMRAAFGLNLPPPPPSVPRIEHLPTVWHAKCANAPAALCMDL